MKFSESIMSHLLEMGYTHCFFVPGGNSMHLLDGARTRMTCVPFVHEMSATIAVEYFNETNSEEKAFVLLTAGPGLTHAISGIAGCYLEGRELLVIGGQVKTTDLASNGLRQRGIQEIDGVALVRSITNYAVRLLSPIDKNSLLEIVEKQRIGKPGPVFLEIPLDVQGANIDLSDFKDEKICVSHELEKSYQDEVDFLVEQLSGAQRPIVLIGGGVTRDIDQIEFALESLGVPVMTTYNGADRLGSEHDLYFGRPNTWGMRYSNILISQADVIVAFGTRLGLQQTGFNHQGFAPSARIIQVDIDATELEKGHPKIERGLECDGLSCLIGLSKGLSWEDTEGWIEYCKYVKSQLPLSEDGNSSHPGFWNPYDFLTELSEFATNNHILIPCSSGGSFTAFYQAFLNKKGQKIVSDKSLASMGYGLAGAIGASIANPNQHVLHVEGDGGFTQNLQELATVAVQQLSIKTFLWCNEGYASIRMTQKNYFDGNYLGCDTSSGLGFPDWQKLGDAYGIPVVEISKGFSNEPDILRSLNSEGPVLFIVRIHPEQTFLPKISSRITEKGSMESEPLWDISPKLDLEMKSRVFKKASFPVIT
jgi:acetolactate synthase-1/2/3 large subunit